MCYNQLSDTAVNHNNKTKENKRTKIIIHLTKECGIMIAESSFNLKQANTTEGKFLDKKDIN
jgi:hypothetical protein